MEFVLLQAISVLEKPDGVIAMPGPDGYVLAARPDHPEAVARMHRIKGRTETPLLLGYDMYAFLPFVDFIPDKALSLINKYWPGPLVLLLDEKTDDSAGGKGFEQGDPEPHVCENPSGKVKLMQPEQPLLLGLLALTPNGVLATCCANRLGDNPARTAQDVLNSFGDDVDFVLMDDDVCREGGAITVVSIDTDGVSHLLRSGRIVID